MRLALPGAVLALVLLAGLAQAAPETLTRDSGDLYPQANGSLASAAGSPAQACLVLSSTAASDSATFAAPLANGTYHPAADSVVLSLALNAGARAGSGFTIHAELAFGNGTTATADKAYGAGASVDLPVGLVFAIPEAARTAGAGNLELAVELASVGTGPIPAFGQDVQVQCSHADTRLYAFRYAVGQPSDTDDNANGIPDSQEAPSGEEGGGTLSTSNVLLVALGAGVVTFMAGMLVLAGRSVGEKRIHVLLGATAGLLIAVAIVDLIPEALESSEGTAAWTIALGLLGLASIGWIAGQGHGHGNKDHGHDEEDAHGPGAHKPGKEVRLGAHGLRFAAVAFFALLFHRLVDGLALPGAFAAGDIVGFTASGAVLIHQFPDGIAAASILVAARLPRSRIVWGVAILSVATPLGALAGLAIAGVEGILPHLLGLAAATFLFIALGELLPELRRPQYRWYVASGFLVGYAVAYGIQLVAKIVGGGV